MLKQSGIVKYHHQFWQCHCELLYMKYIRFGVRRQANHSVLCYEMLQTPAHLDDIIPHSRVSAVESVSLTGIFIFLHILLIVLLLYISHIFIKIFQNTHEGFFFSFWNTNKFFLDFTLNSCIFGCWLEVF